MKEVGFTTKTFFDCFEDLNEDTANTVTWGAENGFSWVEIRDIGASMSSEFVKQLKSTADGLGIKLQYAWDGGDLLLPGDKEILLRGLENASILGANTISRCTISNSSLQNTDSLGYTPSQFEKICLKLNEYCEIAEGYGVILAYENAYEPLYGDQKKFFGMAELINTCPHISVAFDAGNALNKMQVAKYANWTDVKEFYNCYKKNIPYLHIKTTKDHILHNTLIDNGDIDLEWFVENVTSDQWFCLELPGTKNIDKCKSNVKSALATIKRLNEKLI